MRLSFRTSKSCNRRPVHMDAASTGDKLLLSQLLYELGNSEWSKICDRLRDHPLTRLSHDTITEKACQELYAQLVHEMPDDAEGRDDVEPQGKPFGMYGLVFVLFAQDQLVRAAKLHLQLAHMYHAARQQELRQEIIENEADFGRIASEVEQIRNGGWDDRIREEVRAKKVAASKTSYRKVANGASRQHTVNPPDVASQPAEEQVDEQESRQKGAKSVVKETLQDDPSLGSQHDDDDDSRIESPVAEEVPEHAAGTPHDGDAVETDEPESPYVAAAEAAHLKPSSHITPPERELGALSRKGELLPLGKRRASELDSGRPTKKHQEGSEDIERVGDSPSTRRISSTQPGSESKRILQPGTDNKKTINILHERVRGLSHAGLFFSKVRLSNYEDIVREPRSLADIKQRWSKDQTITTVDQYMAEVYRMVCNAIMFNRPQTTTSDDAQQMFEECRALFDNFLAQFS
ncbi:hypothetical protein BKA62DRAFT_813279 [Auriculariales sp. MPI-PUGE-AT-0066]|nr:hypothetical protein BKA62DRAFT_813279 [Auriculariales sp. MPI-PUGE-AT-0066]